MSDALYKATVRLAHSKPHLREHLLPLLKEAKGEVPEAFKKQWKDKDKDNDGKENEPKPDFLKKEDKKKAGEVPEAFKKQWDKKDKGKKDEKDDGDDKKPDFLKKKEDKKASSALRAATIRLAHENPELRKHLLPLLASDFDPTEISETEPGALESESDEPYMKGNFTEQETNELHDKQVGGQLGKAAALRKATIRLAHEKPHLRKHLLPLLQD